MPDGTIVADTLEESLALQRANAQQPEPRSRRNRAASPDQLELPPPQPPQRRRRKAGTSAAANGSKGAPTKNGKAWTPTTFRGFISTASSKCREVVAAGLKLGNGGGSKELARSLGSSMYGIGKRVQKVRTEAFKYNSNLPAPMRLQGDGGEKAVQFDPTFLAASQEGTER